MTASSTTVATPEAFTPRHVDRLLARVDALGPGAPAGLDRETAIAVLGQLQRLQHRPRRPPTYACCPSCGKGFSPSQTRRRASSAPEPPRHPDPIGAADSAQAAGQVTEALGRALLWHMDQNRSAAGGLVHFDGFWAACGGNVLWPLLLTARVAGRDMGAVGLQADPAHMAETLATVCADLEAMGPDSDDPADAVRQWELIADLELRVRQSAFAYAHLMVGHWQRTGNDAS